MEREKRWGREASYVAAFAIVLACAGCAGDRGKFVGTWSLDLGRAAELAPAFSLTWTFSEDGTGRMTTTQSVNDTGPQTVSVDFEWKLEDDKLIVSMSDAGMVTTHTYEFDEDGALLLRMGGQPPMRYLRVR
jgi:hypothetical protein